MTKLDDRPAHLTHDDRQYYEQLLNEYGLARSDPGQQALATLQRMAGIPTSPRRAERRQPPEGSLPSVPAEPKAAQPIVALHLSEETYRELLEALADAMVVVNEDGLMVLVNAQTERMFGYQREELLGQPIELLVPEHYRSGHVEQRQRYFRNPKSRPMGIDRKLLGRRKDASLFAVEISLTPIQTEKGTLAASIIRDISLQEREAAKFRTLVENIPAVTFIAPLDERVPELYVSPQIEQLLGFTQREWVEDPVLWHRQLHPEDRDRWNGEFAPTCAIGKPFDSAYRFLAKDGRVVWVHGSARMVRDAEGKLLFLQGVAFDITKIKEAEVALRVAQEELRRANLDLEQRVKERTKELEDFARQASHDLSKPLLSLKSYPTKLAENYRGKIDPKADDWIDRTIGGAQRLDRLIKSLKQYALAVESVRWKPTNATASARDARANLAVDIEQSGAVVTLEELPTVMGDHDQLVFLFQNLIGNALKFLEPQRPLRVDVGARWEQAGWLFWVRDNGLGIEAKYLPKLLQDFFGDQVRVAASPSKYPGNGYGLHICKKIVTRYGGRIWVESEFGQGSTFYFTLPACPGVK